jgi:hypothetical protein
LLPPIQQHELLALAVRAGALPAAQLPALTSTDRSRAFFMALLQSASTDVLPPFRPEPIDPIDAELDPDQVDAVVRAVQTPDVALICGGPGTGKSRVIAEVICQAARCGMRVLLAAPTAAALDIVLERLAGDEAVVGLRCLGRGERTEALPPVAAARTLAALRGELAEQTRTRNRQNLSELALSLTQARADALVMARLAGLAMHFGELKARHDEAVAGIASPGLGDEFARQLAVDQAAHDAQLQRLDEAERTAAGELQAAQKRIAELDAHLATHQRVEAGRGWFAKLLPFGAGRSAAQAQHWTKEVDEQRIVEGRAKKRAEEIALERQQVVATWQSESGRRVAGETARRRTEFEQKRAQFAAELAAAEPELRRTAAELSSRASVFDTLDPTAVARAMEALRRAIEQAEAEEAFARRWAEYLDADADELPQRLLGCVNLAAAPLSAVANDETLAELTRDRMFDLLIVDEAHRVTETDLLAAARRAGRWVLVGEADEETTEPQRERRGRAGPWRRLEQALESHCWHVEGSRVCCRLTPLSPAQRGELETERVADSPNVELRIWTPPRGEPVLAEVLFPAGWTIEQALEYLHRELNEVPAATAAMRWTETNGRIVGRLFDGPAPRSATLAPGLVAQLQEQRGVLRLAAMEFDPAAGWDRPRAETWARQSLRFTDAGRVARLHAQHRMHPEVAALACALGSEGVCPPARPAPLAAGPAVEFIPVPALANEPLARRRGDIGVSGQQRRLPPLRGGAGFEFDLADPRQRERLQAEILPILPPRGFVNLPEVEAVVRLLEILIADLPASTAERPGSIAVLPLYEAQAALVRRLMSQSHVLAASPVPVHVAAAGDFRQREADVIIVSLTRSHNHRAVTYGDEPAVVPLALTRARQRLVLVGDPGTLARRAHWDGPLDHLDADAAARERGWVAALVRLLQGNGSATIHLREGPP